MIKKFLPDSIADGAFAAGNLRIYVFLGIFCGVNNIRMVRFHRQATSITHPEFRPVSDFSPQ